MVSNDYLQIWVRQGDSLEAAFKKANASDKGVIINIAEGEYEVYDTLVIKRNNISIIGENNNVKLKGSKKIQIDNTGRTIVTINLKKNGINDAGQFGQGPFKDFWEEYDIPKPHMTDFGPGMELFYKNRHMPVSRYPKDGYIFIKKSLGKTYTYYKNERNGSAEGIFIADDDEITTFKNFNEIMLVGYWQYDWATQRHMIEDIDKNTGIIKVKKPYHCFGYRDGRSYFDDRAGMFYALNVKEKISLPGEWAVNRKNMEVYLYPYEGQKYVEISCVNDMIYANGYKNIKISGISISQCRKSGIVLENCSDINLSDINIQNVGAWGILGENCNNMIVSQCEICHTGGGGIGINGGNRQTLISCGNIISNCVIHNIAVWHKTYMAAIDISGVGCTISQNLIYDVPHFGIVFSGNNHIIKKNEIKNACYESNDAGAVYSGRNYTYRGNIIRYNYIHDLYGYNNAGCMGVYFDDGMSSASVYGNIFTNIPHMAVLIGGGRDFKIHNNIFFNCRMAINYDKRIFFVEELQERLKQRLAEIDYKSTIWKKAYPDLYNIYDNNIYLPLGNEIYKNTVIGGEGFALQMRDMCDITKIFDNTFIDIKENVKHKSNYDDWHYITK